MLYSRTSGALVMSNRDGLAMLEVLRSGKGRNQLALKFSASQNISKTDGEALIKDTISAWQHAGLLDQSKRPFPGEIPYRAPKIAAAESWFSLAGRRIQLCSENANLAAQVDVLLEPYRDENRSNAAIKIDALQTADGILVFTSQEPVWGLASEDEARYLILREAIEALCGIPDVAAILHAGCVERDGSGILLAGATGSGKSTLTLGLVDAGWTYVGDDLIGLKRDGANAIALPMPAGLKIGSRSLSAIRNLRGEDPIKSPSPRSDVEYFFPRRSAEPGMTIGIDAIIFPKWGAGMAFKSSPVMPEDALARLLQSGSELSRRARSIAPLANLLNKVPCYALQFSEMKEAVQACCEIHAPSGG